MRNYIIISTPAHCQARRWLRQCACHFPISLRVFGRPVTPYRCPSAGNRGDAKPEYHGGLSRAGIIWRSRSWLPDLKRERAAGEDPALAFSAFRLTSPGCRTRSTGRTFAQANGMTGQGLGEVTSEARNVAGNPVLGEGGFFFFDLERLVYRGRSLILPASTIASFPLRIESNSSCCKKPSTRWPIYSDVASLGS